MILVAEMAQLLAPLRALGDLTKMQPPVPPF